MQNELTDVRRALTAGEISQSVLAARAGVSQPAVSDWFRGKSSDIKLSTATRLIRALAEHRAAISKGRNTQKKWKGNK